jgi:hypothetical protein
MNWALLEIAPNTVTAKKIKGMYPKQTIVNIGPLYIAMDTPPMNIPLALTSWEKASPIPRLIWLKY